MHCSTMQSWYISPVQYVKHMLIEDMSIIGYDNTDHKQN